MKESYSLLKPGYDKTVLTKVSAGKQDQTRCEQPDSFRLPKPLKSKVSAPKMLLIIPHCTEITMNVHNYGKYGR